MFSFGETAEELNSLKILNVDNVQGYFIGRPAPIEDALSFQNKALPA
ncbi:hypothetical protein LOC50_06445 [Pseudoalteromonas sp. SCSIO 43095]|nr:hypothetical protein [Pseudoalteromonas sp. SCSIO 43095]URQ99908.1 hypothetical protein LOC50_06445 [Pseudoalteromonas sp. SCSIO 43095]